MKTQHTPIAYGGLALVRELREEANEIALDNRADLVRRGADEIARLIEETKQLRHALNEMLREFTPPLECEDNDALILARAALAALQGGGL